VAAWTPSGQRCTREPTAVTERAITFDVVRPVSAPRPRQVEG
jgi:hypothetical protein